MCTCALFQFWFLLNRKKSLDLETIETIIRVKEDPRTDGVTYESSKKRLIFAVMKLYDAIKLFTLNLCFVCF